MGSGQPYYPIDPWTLEGVLFNCSTTSLKISKKGKIVFGGKIGGKKSNKDLHDFRGQNWGQNPIFLLRSNSQSSQNIKKD